MAENQWGSWGGFLGSLEEEFKKNVETNFTKVVDLMPDKTMLETEFQRGVEGLKTVLSQNNELSAFLGLGDKNQQKIDQPPPPAPTPPPAQPPAQPPAPAKVAPAKTAPAPATARIAPPPPLSRADSNSRQSSGSNKESTESKSSSLFRSASVAGSSFLKSASVAGSSLSGSASVAGSSIKKSLSFASSTPSEKNQSTRLVRKPSKDDLRPEGGEKKLPFLKRVSSGLGQRLSSCASSLSRGGSVYFNYEVSRRDEIIVKGKRKLSLPSLPETPSLKRVGSVFSGLRRGASGLGISLSKTLGEASETIRETRRGSSGLGGNWDDTKSFFRSFKSFGSGGFPSPNPIPKSWRNPLSNMSGVSSNNYTQDAKNALGGVGGLMGAAGNQVGGVLGSWAKRVKEGTSGLSGSVRLTRQ